MLCFYKNNGGFYVENNYYNHYINKTIVTAKGYRMRNNFYHSYKLKQQEEDASMQ